MKRVVVTGLLRRAVWVRRDINVGEATFANSYLDVNGWWPRSDAAPEQARAEFGGDPGREGQGDPGRSSPSPRDSEASMYLDGYRKEILAWVKEGLSDRAIAERCRVSRSTVRYWRERNGVERPLRDRKGPRLDTSSE
jgi:hypothetical protein